MGVCHFLVGKGLSGADYDRLRKLDLEYEFYRSREGLLNLFADGISDGARPEVKAAFEHYRLQALAIRGDSRNVEDISANDASAHYLDSIHGIWRHMETLYAPAETAAAAERLADALERREPEAEPLLPVMEDFWAWNVKQNGPPQEQYLEWLRDRAVDVFRSIAATCRAMEAMGATAVAVIIEF